MIWIVFGVLVVGTTIGVARTLRLVGWPSADDPTVEDRTVVTLTGFVRTAEETLISPLSARRCVMFEAYANLYEWPSEAEGEPERRVLSAQLARQQLVPFVLETELGPVRIEAHEADLELVPAPVFPRIPEREALFLREHDRDERLVENATFEEVTIDPDELISVHGLVVVEGPDRIRIVPDGDTPIVIGTPRRSVVS